MHVANKMPCKHNTNVYISTWGMELQRSAHVCVTMIMLTICMMSLLGIACLNGKHAMYSN